MPKDRIAGTVVIILLLFSVVSTIYLALQQKAQQFPASLEAGTFTSKPSIGLVEIYGQIYSSYGEGGLIPTGGPDDILDTLKYFREDKRVKAVIVRINSPGGTIGAVQEITREIQRLRASGKPVVASIADIGASGGYYIASACDKIVANEGSIIGSIGVIFMSPDMSLLMEKLGIKMETIKSGPYKDMGSFYRPFSTQERKFLTELIDDAYNQFVAAVSSSRDIPVNRLRELAKGQIYSGVRARKLKLIDSLGDMVQAKKIAEDMAGIKESRLIRRPFGKWKRVLEFFGRGGFPINLMGKERSSGLAYLYKP